MGYGYYYDFSPYVSVAERRRIAAREMRKLMDQGHPVSPVAIEGRMIARTFWGKSWCDNLERYSDFDSRLPRGRTYVRNGSVVDLQIAPGEVKAFVMGSELYKVAVKVSAVPSARWRSICSDCAGSIDSLVELLQGQFSKGVMERICEQSTGLFPAPAEISFSCSCPDWASMCKHVAAVLYGIGARLDEKPQLLFKLRKVDEKALLDGAGKGLCLTKRALSEQKVLAAEDLSTLFGLEMSSATDEPVPAVEQTRPAPAAHRRGKRGAPAVEEAAVARAVKTKSMRKATTKPRSGELGRIRAKAKTAKKPQKAKAAPSAPVALQRTKRTEAKATQHVAQSKSKATRPKKPKTKAPPARTRARS